MGENFNRQVDTSEVSFAGNVDVNSCAGMVVDMINSTLSVDEIDKLTVLRMNKEFMEFMRKEYPEVVTLKTSHRSY